MPSHDISSPDSGQDLALTAAPSGEVLNRIKTAHPAAFTWPPKPLALGTRAALIAAHPQIESRLLRIALARWCGRPGYARGLIAGGPRHALDGSPCGEVSEAHRAAAVLRLERLATRQERKPDRPRTPKVPPPVIKTRSATTTGRSTSRGSKVIFSPVSERPLTCRS